MGSHFADLETEALGSPGRSVMEPRPEAGLQLLSHLHLAALRASECGDCSTLTWDVLRPPRTCGPPLLDHKVKARSGDELK